MSRFSQTALSKMWELLEPRERKMAWPVVAMMFLSALASVGMVGAILPFLYVLSHPEVFATSPLLQRLVGWTGGTTQAMYALGGFAMLAVALAVSLGMLRVYMVSRYTGMRAFALSNKMLTLLIRQPYADTSALSLAAASRRVNLDPGEAIANYMMPLGEAMASFIAACAMLAFLVWFNVSVTVVLVGMFVILYTSIHVFVRPRLRAAGQARIAANSQRSHTFNELIRCFREVRMSAHEEVFCARFQSAARDEAQTRVKAEVLSKIPRYAMQATFFLSVVGAAMLLLAFGGGPGEALTKHIPTVGVFMLAGQRMMPEIQNLFSAVSQMSYGAPTVHAVHAAHAEMRAKVMVFEESPAVRLGRSIEVVDVHHRYPDRDVGALQGVSLVVPKGQKLGLVGASGSGKSTLVSIMMGLVPPTEGLVSVDGAALGDNPVGWRLSVAQVPQDVVLVSGSVRANVALGEEPASVDEDRLWRALRAAHLDSFVEGLPLGLDTDVMTGVASISGGQRQRLGLARAFYRDADVLVLDEATSALDEATEASILAEVEAATEGKTVISVAHRLGTLRGCDRIVALDQGRIVFDGDWEAFRSWKTGSVS